MFSPSFQRLILLFCLLLMLQAACTLPPAPSAPTASPSPAIALTISPTIPSPSFTPLATRTQIPTPSPILTPASGSTTPDYPRLSTAYVASGTQAWAAATAAGTAAAPIPTKDSFLQDLNRLGYFEWYGSSHPGPGGYTYSAYIFLDSTFSYGEMGNTDPQPYPTLAFRYGRPTEGCRIVFYRSDGNQNVFLYNFPPAKYPPADYLGGDYYAGFPVWCWPNDWRDPQGFYPGFLPLDSNTAQLLSLDGVWSDINQNGLPEFSVQYQFCPNGCSNFGALSTHLYEIQTTSKVVDISPGLPGVMNSLELVHSTDPLDFWVYDPTLEYCYHCTIITHWIYAWNGTKFVDVTPKYADEYRKQGEQRLSEIRKMYGQYQMLDVWRLLEILFLYQKAGLRDEAMQAFLEISDPAHWPSDDIWFDCSLQMTRAAEQENYRLGKPFAFPPYNIYEHRLDGQLKYPNGLKTELTNLNPTRNDLSACLAILPGPHPTSTPKTK